MRCIHMRRLPGRCRSRAGATLDAGGWLSGKGSHSTSPAAATHAQSLRPLADCRREDEHDCRRNGGHRPPELHAR